MISLKLVKNMLTFIIIAMCIGRARLDVDVDDATNGETRIIYDQRQSGKYNIHVVIKDVAIIEMDQNEIEDVNYSNDDYYYDENDLTVKPITLNPTTTTMTLPSTTIGIEPTKRKSSTSIPYTTATKTTPSQEMVASGTTLLNQHDESSTVDTTILWNTLLPSTPLSQRAKKPALNNTLLTSTALTNHTETHRNFPTDRVDLKPRSKVEPIYAIEDASLQPKYREVSVPLETEGKPLTNSKIYKVKVHRSHQSNRPLRTQSRRCRSNQYRDISGNCQAKRSPAGSLLKRLFSMLVTLPFVRNEPQHDNE